MAKKVKKIVNLESQPIIENNEISSKKKKKKNRNLKFIISLIINIVLVISIIGLIICLFQKNENHNILIDDYIDLRREKTSVSVDLNLLLKGKSVEYVNDKLYFFDNNIVFVLDGYGKYYYSYDCVQEITDGDEYSFWIYHPEDAKAKGFRKGKC